MIIGTVVATAGIVEVCSRVLLAAYWTPSVLMYGTPFGRINEYKLGINAKKFWGQLRWDTIIGANEAHWQKEIRTEVGSYRKYPAGFQRPMVLADGSKYTSVLNNNGMRGRDFQLKKKTGVIRVITLGASSTYGYRNKDDETYPYYLEQFLNKELAQRYFPGIASFEVFNFGMPQFYSDEIRALFMNEAIRYSPDIVTFYEGANDTRRIKREKSKSFMIAMFYKPLHALSRYSLLARYLTFIFDRYVETFSADDVKGQIKGKPEFFLAQVKAIADECKKRGIIFIAISQSLNAEILTRKETEKTSYEAEVGMIKKRTENGGRIGPQELMLLIHAEIMAQYQDWATANNIPFVDFIAALDRRQARTVMVNWVHLDAEGNRLLAEELCKTIIEAYE